jgi:drug/metabolite transporter (DMT)-like permease
LKLLLPGLLLCGNWYFYVLSIKVSSIAIAIISLFTYPLLLSIIEPFVFRVRHRAVDLVGGCAIVAGVTLIAPRFTLADTAVQGICLGVLSGLCFALSSMASRKLVSRYSSMNLMWYQFLTIAVVFSPSPFVYAKPVSLQTVVFLFILGGVLTTLAQVSFVASLKTTTTAVASMFTSTQPFFAVVLAAIFLHEIPTRRTIIGGLIVCAAVAGVSLWHLLEQRHASAGRHSAAGQPDRLEPS